MKNLKYLIQYISIIFLFFIFKLLGFKYSLTISSKIISLLGPLFRSNKLIKSNFDIAFPKLDNSTKNKFIKEMWENYGKILAEYMFIKDFRFSKLSQNIEVEGQEVLEDIKKNNQPVIFISGHFNNFELMAMQIDKSGIDLATIYRPLNNKYLNKIMERIRKKYICNKQIKKGISGTKLLLNHFKKGSSIALMIDQRVSEGIKCDFFNKRAFTTTIPAQFIKKFKCKVVPVYIERKNNFYFKLTIQNPIQFSDKFTNDAITLELNNILEKMIIKNPSQWIWTHNRWK
jgi:Kdo2-lipid IVA lauroyltransferase/acyltransferase